MHVFKCKRIVEKVQCNQRGMEHCSDSLDLLKIFSDFFFLSSCSVVSVKVSL